MRLTAREQKNFQENFTWLVDTYKINQTWIASEMGYTPQAVSEWKSGGGAPRKESIPQLEELCAVPSGTLLGDPEKCKALRRDRGGRKEIVQFTETLGQERFQAVVEEGLAIREPQRLPESGRLAEENMELRRQVGKLMRETERLRVENNQLKLEIERLENGG